MPVQLSSQYLQSIVDYVKRITPTSTITGDQRITISGIVAASMGLECTIDHDPINGCVEFSIRSTIVVSPRCRQAVETLIQQTRTIKSSDQIDMDAKSKITFTFYYRSDGRYLSDKEIEGVMLATVSRISLYETEIQHIISSS